MSDPAEIRPQIHRSRVTFVPVPRTETRDQDELRMDAQDMGDEASLPNNPEIREELLRQRWVMREQRELMRPRETPSSPFQLGPEVPTHNEAWAIPTWGVLMEALIQVLFLQRIGKKPLLIKPKHKERLLRWVRSYYPAT